MRREDVRRPDCTWSLRSFEHRNTIEITAARLLSTEVWRGSLRIRRTDDGQLVFWRYLGDPDMADILELTRGWEAEDLRG